MTSQTDAVLSHSMTDHPATRFWDRAAARYSRSPIADEAAYQTKLSMTREYMDSDMSVLEFACGTGSTALLHAPYVKTIDAIDVSGNMIAIAQEKAEAADITNVSFSKSAIEQFDAPVGSFDMVMAMSILHLLADRQAAIAKVFSFLKPGGTFVSSTVCLSEGYSIFKILGPIGKAVGLLPTLRVFSSDELVADLRTAGFQIERQWRPEEPLIIPRGWVG
jgi:2-polyprenyl-3-methyl-5-hydroxy-6-metoxy-1,4-benzoquinol methylase